MAIQAMKCEICGSNDLVKQSGLYVCQHCGTKYTVEEARQLIGTVKIDKTDDMEKWRTLARRARREGNAQNAAKYYEMIKEQDPDDWEASFFQTYYQVCDCKLYQIANNTIALTNAIPTAAYLISKYSSNHIEDEQAAEAYNLDAYTQVFNACKVFRDSVAATANNHCNQFRNTEERGSAAQTVTPWIQATFTLTRFVVEIGNTLKGVTGTPQYKEMMLDEISFLTAWRSYMPREDYNKRMAELTERIREIDPEYQAPSAKKKKKGCYIATCVYGSYDCPEVWTLRRYRDHTLAGKWYGKSFIRVYYTVSPAAVKLLGNSRAVRNLWKKMLDGFVRKLNSEGISDGPYTD